MGSGEGDGKTWTFTPLNCSCAEDHEDLDCPARETIFCGWFDPAEEDDPTQSHEAPTL